MEAFDRHFYQGMANIITCFRILVSFALLFFPLHSVPFYSLYLTAGISDMVDGMVARRTNMPDQAASSHGYSNLAVRLDWRDRPDKGHKHCLRVCDAEKVCGSTHSYEQGHTRIAVCSAADYPAYRTKPWRDCCLRYSDVRRDSGRTFDSVRR
jgi:hypothetical protein